MSQYIYPDKLKTGDKVIVVTPSGAIESALVEKAALVLTEWGLDVRIAPHAISRVGRYCGTIEDRLQDLQNAMDDVDAKAIFCSRGGSGVIHLLEKLDFANIRKHPKWLIGYSDITALHASFFKNKLVSLHAPMAKHLAVDEETNAT